jgi:hypothetical protein
LFQLSFWKISIENKRRGREGGGVGGRGQTDLITGDNSPQQNRQVRKEITVLILLWRRNRNRNRYCHMNG